MDFIETTEERFKVFTISDKLQNYHLFDCFDLVTIQTPSIIHKLSTQTIPNTNEEKIMILVLLSEKEYMRLKFEKIDVKSIKKNFFKTKLENSEIKLNTETNQETVLEKSQIIVNVLERDFALVLTVKKNILMVKNIVVKSNLY